LSTRTQMGQLAVIGVLVVEGAQRRLRPDLGKPAG
jgi:hypothetical protein